VLASFVDVVTGLEDELQPKAKAPAPTIAIPAKPTK
jgi:hypothetical protein